MFCSHIGEMAFQTPPAKMEPKCAHSYRCPVCGFEWQCGHCFPKTPDVNPLLAYELECILEDTE